MNRPLFPLNVGDKVCYARTFLHNIVDYSLDSASRRGTITWKAADLPERVKVQWDDALRESQLVLCCNLIPVDKKHLEPV
jgi:hypothetical protein